LQKEQEELTIKINSINEECRKSKNELSEYENTRLLTKQFDIERLTEHIYRLNEKIDNSEKEQIKKKFKEGDYTIETCWYKCGEFQLGYGKHQDKNR
jgi:predicted nuclease with TOPRIM domain